MDELFGIFESIGWDFLARGRLRRGVILGAILGLAAGLLACGAITARLNLHVLLLVLFACGVLGLLGSWFCVRQDIDDQDSGRMSMTGDWFELWGNNRWSNGISECGLLFGMFVFALLFFAVLADPNDGFAHKYVPSVVADYEKYQVTGVIPDHTADAKPKVEHYSTASTQTTTHQSGAGTATAHHTAHHHLHQNQAEHHQSQLHSPHSSVTTTE